MATLSDLKEVKEALDAGLVSQSEFDEVKRDYLRAKKEALEFRKRELLAKEAFQKRSPKRICGRTLSSRLSSTGPAS